jgi:light-regulated signal transduction histidine kinase (bacteriophytochrome)
VKDNGISIKPEDIDRVFIDFQQLDAGFAKKYPRTGLGLALTKKSLKLNEVSLAWIARLGKAASSMRRYLKHSLRQLFTSKSGECHSAADANPGC